MWWKWTHVGVGGTEWRFLVVRADAIKTHLTSQLVRTVVLSFHMVYHDLVG